MEIQKVDFVGIPSQDAERSRRSFRVDDVAGARAEVEAKGVTFDGDVFESKVCHMTTFHDPDGNELMLHRRFAPYADGTMP
jgi:predicted enzyme related to lactoylglutathione lyase